MSTSMVFYFTNIAPHYRKEIWRLLALEKKWDFHFVFGDNYAQSKILQIDTGQDWIRQKHFKVKNLSFKGVLFWQQGVISLAYKRKIDQAILLGDMHILSNWLLALLFRLKGVQVFYWGHGFTGKEANMKKWLRVIFNRLAHEHFLYSERSKKIMQELGFKKNKLHVINNSLSHSLQKKLRISSIKDKPFPFFKIPTLPVLVFIGRLSTVKRLDVLLEAFDLLNAEEQKFNLLLIGDGSERIKLQAKVLSQGYEDHVHFFGSSYHEETNAKLLANSDLCISPGNVGLTAMHCMTYGTPCATHNDFSYQMPEFESIKQGVTGFFFERNNAKDLAKKIEIWFNKKATKRMEVRQSCYQMVDDYYNPEFQLSIFKKVLLGH